VFDPTNAAIVNATVTIHNDATNAEQTLTSDTSGYFKAAAAGAGDVHGYGCGCGLQWVQDGRAGGSGADDGVDAAPRDRLCVDGGGSHDAGTGLNFDSLIFRRT